MTDGQTGYPSVDRPWTKYYKNKPLREFDVEQCTYQLLYELNKENLDKVALNFMGIRGNSWSYKEMFDLSEKLSDAFIRCGVKAGETVVIATVSGLEEPLCFLALNKIGAISKWIDITLSEEEIQEAINVHNCRIAVVFSYILPRLQNIIDKTSLEKVIVTEPKQFFRMNKILTNSVKAIRDFVSVIKSGKEAPLPAIPRDNRYIGFMRFVNEGTLNQSFRGAKYEKDQPVLMIQSSGTTGKPKTIVHTNYSINCSIRKWDRFDMPLYAGKTMLNVAPAWVGYGLINTMITALAYGMEVIMTPALNDDMLITFNQKYDVVFGVPVIFRYLDSHLDRIQSMSRPTGLLTGGDKIEKSEIERFEKDFASKGCKVPLLNGAGSNEILGAGYINPLHANKPGTVGIPMCEDITSVFDPETLEEKKYGEEGEVCVQSNATMLYYESNVSETAKVKRVHSDGKIWVHTNDIGKIDSDGYLYLIGRLNRVIAIDGFKISASQIEEVAYEFDSIKEAVAVAAPDKESFEVPMLFFVLKDDFQGNTDDVIDKLRDLYLAKLKGRAVPKYYYCIDKIPYTSNNKQDFRKLEAIAKEYVKKSEL